MSRSFCIVCGDTRCQHVAAARALWGHLMTLRMFGSVSFMVPCSESKQLLKPADAHVYAGINRRRSSFIDLKPRDVDGEAFMSGITEDPPIGTDPSVGHCLLPPPLLVILGFGTGKPQSPASGAQIRAFFPLIIRQERVISTVCATFSPFLQTVNGTRRLKPACCISFTRSRSHGLPRIWVGAPVLPWIFTHRTAVGRAIRSVGATW